MMTADLEFMYWQTNSSWYRINVKKDCYELTELAPERAVKSFEQYCKKQIASGSTKYKKMV